MQFIGRVRELSILEGLIEKPNAHLVVIRGRRRIGKSRLVEEIGKKYQFLRFAGIAPTEGIEAQTQRQAFSNQLSSQMNLPQMVFYDWDNAFEFLHRSISTKPTVLLFDEISWMGSKDPSFLPKLKNAWDFLFSKNQNLLFILCGSVSTWIEKNIIQSTAFFGRIHKIITLEPFSLSESMSFLKLAKFQTSAHEILKVLSVTGGIPWYLEQIDGTLTADENIKQMCFLKDSTLVGEFDRIFEDVFSKRGRIYKEIMEVLIHSPCNQTNLRKKLNYGRSGSISKYLHDLILCGFVEENKGWSLKTLKPTKQSIYAVKDQFIRFHFRFINAQIQKINQNLFETIPLSQLPGWDGLVGLQVETLVAGNVKRLYQDLKIPLEDIMASGVFSQKGTTTRKGCQIDRLIQLRTGVLYAVEIKFSRNIIGAEIIEEMKTKLNNLERARNSVVNPVLIHLNGVSDKVVETNYFYKIIDLNDWLKT
ncbi:MAG: ATPase [Alphaproteobacteria bacterium]|nr:ATPase [Alphaproteobacteria bacterium]